MDKDNDFGKKLKEIRIAKGLSQAKLAEMAGIHEKHISKIETGRFYPNFETLNKILKSLDLKFDTIDVNLENVSISKNNFYFKSMQILNQASDQELEYYYCLLKTAQKGLNIFKKQL